MSSDPDGLQSPQPPTWEAEYARFEARYWECQVHPFWRASGVDLVDPLFGSVIERFCREFPEHISPHNTLFYLFQDSGQHPVEWSLLLVSEHFEYSSPADGHRLMRFLEWAADTLTESSWTEVECWDSTLETVRLRFHDLRSSVIESLQHSASYRSAPGVN